MLLACPCAAVSHSTTSYIFESNKPTPKLALLVLELYLPCTNLPLH